MTERRLLSFIITEGLLTLLLGLSVLILPKITLLTFGFVLSLAFIIYGGYRLISSILFKNYSEYYIFNLLAGLVLLISGGLLFFAPVIDILYITSAIGLYFIISSLSISAFGIRGNGILSGINLIFVLSFIEVLWSILVITTISSSTLWLAGIITGLDFIISGVVFINVYIATDRKSV